jgi:DNA-binding SARP family transcriptional activator
MQPSLNSQVLLGARVQVQRAGGDSFEARGKSALALTMAALEGSAQRRRMALLLWPNSAEPQALNNLRTLVHRLNQRFGGELLKGAEHLQIDSARAHVTLQGSDELLAALGAGGAERCELLAEAGIEAGADEALGDWLEATRHRLRRTQLVGLSEALGRALAEGLAGRAIALARACVQLDPLSEQWHRQLMDTLARCGDRAAALAAYEDCKALLRQQLGVMPDLQTRAVHLRQSGVRRYPLVEREAVLAEVLGALTQGQHVALNGEAGVGKTRLLRQLAEQAEPRGIEQVVIRPGARNEPYAALAQVLQEVQPRRAPRIGVPEQIELARLAPLAFPEVQPSQASLSAPRLHAALRQWAIRLKHAGVQPRRPLSRHCWHRLRTSPRCRRHCSWPTAPTKSTRRWPRRW